MKVFAVLSIVVLIFLSQNSAIAQRPESLPVSSIGLGIGYSLDHIKDTNFSPLNQKGNALVYSIFYERRSNNILKINIEYGDGILKSGLSNRLESSYYKANIGVTYLKNMAAEKKAINFYVGGTYNLKVLYLDWYDQDAFSYISTNGLSISAAISNQLASRHYIESTVSIPVLQALSRPPYNGIDEYIIENQDNPIKIILDGKLSSFKQYQAFNWNVNYRYEISDYLDWKVAYTLDFQKVADPDTFTSLSNRFSTGILYKF